MFNKLCTAKVYEPLDNQKMFILTWFINHINDFLPEFFSIKVIIFSILIFDLFIVNFKEEVELQVMTDCLHNFQKRFIVVEEE